MNFKKWYYIQFIVIGTISFLYSIWNVVLEAYGINLHSEIFGPALVGILVTSGVIMILVAIYKELKEIKNESN